MTSALNDVIIEALENVKGQDISVLDVRDLSDVMDSLIVVSGNTTRQVRALADSVIEDCKQAGFRPLGVEGADVGEWVLVDLGDTVVHIMLPTTRAFYDLERLWSMRPGDLGRTGADSESGASTAGD